MTGFTRSASGCYELLIEGQASYEERTYLVVHVSPNNVRFCVEQRFPREYIEERRDWYQRAPAVSEGPSFQTYDLRIGKSYSRALLAQIVEWLGRDELRSKAEMDAVFTLVWGLLIKPGSDWAAEAAPDWYRRIRPDNLFGQRKNQGEEHEDDIQTPAP